MYVQRILTNIPTSRQAMPGNLAWKRHGCYQLGSQQYYNMPLDKSTLGCHDDWNALDHFDPTADSRRLFAQFNYLRSHFVALQDGYALTELGNWTYYIQREGSNGTATEMGLWSISRSEMSGVQSLTGTNTNAVWMFFTNENSTNTWTYDCNDTLWISSPYESGTVVQNLFYPYETYTLEQSSSSYNNDSQAPWFGCLGSITMDGYGFKALVPVANWLSPPPALTAFTPGHDYRINSETSGTSVDISLEFNTEMDCNSVTNSITLAMSSSSTGSIPTISNANCANMNSSANVVVQGVSRTQWVWNATLTNFGDGILNITVNNPSSSSGNSTGVSTCQRGGCYGHADIPSPIRLQMFCFYEKVCPTMSWCFRITTTTLPPSRKTAMIISSLIRLTAQTCSVIRGTSGKIGRIGRTGKILQPLI